MALHRPRPEDLPLPGLDERLIMPGTRYEAVDGEIVYVSPAEPPHASRHSKLSALLEAYAADGYDAASDMLTRTSALSDMAPDGSIYPSEPDPETGGRQLEALVFEVVSTQTLGFVAKKAAGFARRGVRRIFAIDVEHARVCEWSSATNTWAILRNDDVITDEALVAPLSVGALAGAASVDDAVARALLAKHNPVLAEARAEGEARGRAEGVARGRAEGTAMALVTVLEARFGPLPEAVRTEVLAADEAALQRWLVRAASAPGLDDVVAGR